MTYARAFFDLQLRFARAVSLLAGLPLERALLEYTNLYIRFGLGRDFDPAHPAWREYLAGVGNAGDGVDWTHRFYLARPPDAGAPAVEATFGCFSYARAGSQGIRLHFRNADVVEHSPLGAGRQGLRRAELAALFAHVRRTTALPLRVLGASWLYNLEAYRRLFPPSYLASAHVLPRRYQHMPLWGQFLDRHGEVSTDRADLFLQRLRRQSSLENLDRCFPCPVLAVEAPIQDFYEFHGV